MRNLLATAALCAMTAGAVSASAPEASLRPMPRPAAVETVVQAAVVSARPRARPALPADLLAEAPEAPVLAHAGPALAPAAQKPGIFANMFRPKPRPPEQVVAAAAVRVRPGAALVQPRKGSVCGDPSIRGEVLAPITGKLRGCGIDEPVKITSVDGVKLSMAATVDCSTAKALKTWINRGLRPAMGEVMALQVAGAYTCRSRNNQSGAPISEHGRGKAIDISGITLASGKTVTVEGGWRSKEGRGMQQAHKAACGIFGTTLGPGSDGFHEDHLHFDTIPRRKAYCR
ncbi:MAG: extensin family protein [Cereibacter changlensis]|uniref:Extensin family protein n=2 Tax=Cereibacter changlensis TaxID=402884 RepID=A0A2T4JRE5_9RHOB|nr:extensin family protein [Cereibacter changlensis]PTE20490.1 extensin family protein [Cereibacter changlensis JA139]PZX55084.1 hypothetical protein LX76_01609 [Cereibacter changlensis]